MRVLSAGITRAHAPGSLREVKFPPYWLRRQPRRPRLRAICLEASAVASLPAHPSAVAGIFVRTVAFDCVGIGHRS